MERCGVMKAPTLPRQALLRGVLACTLAKSPLLSILPALAEAPVQFEADDGSFAFLLPPGWVGTTRPDQERGNPAHLFDIRAQS